MIVDTDSRLGGCSSAENTLPRLQPLQPQKPAGRVAVYHLQHQDRRSELPQHLPFAERNLSHPPAHRRSARRIYCAAYRQRWSVEPESEGDPRSFRHHRGKIRRANAEAVAQDERRGGRSLFAIAAGNRQESGALRVDVFAGQAGLPRGHALLAHRQTPRLGQADTKRQALRAARYGSPAIQNPTGASLFVTREYDFSRARYLHPDRSPVR